MRFGFREKITKVLASSTVAIFLAAQIISIHPASAEITDGDTADELHQEISRNKELLEIWKDHVKTLTGDLAGQLPFQLGQDPRGPVQVFQWIAIGGAVEHLARIVGQLELDTDDAIVGYTHGRSRIPLAVISVGYCHGRGTSGQLSPVRGVKAVGFHAQ